MGGNGFWCPTLLLPLSLSLHLLSYCSTPTCQPALGEALTAGFLSSTTPDMTSVTPMSSVFPEHLRSPLPQSLTSIIIIITCSATQFEGSDNGFKIIPCYQSPSETWRRDQTLVHTLTWRNVKDRNQGSVSMKILDTGQKWEAEM